MSEDAVAILERLLNQEGGFPVTHCLKSSRDFYDADWTFEEVNSIEAEFDREFQAVASQVEADWGVPDFIGRGTESEFRELCMAEELCYWRKGEKLAVIWWEHQDKELPFTLTCAVICPEKIAA